MCLGADQFQKRVRSPSSGGVLIDVGVGVEGDKGLGMLLHAGGEDAVQVERDDQRQVRAEHLASPLEHPALGVPFLLAGHRSMQAEVDGVEVAGVGDGPGEFVDQPVKISVVDRASGHRPGGHASDRFDLGLGFVEHVECTGDLGIGTASCFEQLLTVCLVEVVVAGQRGIERGGFLLEFRDEDPEWHRR